MQRGKEAKPMLQTTIANTVDQRVSGSVFVTLDGKRFF